MKQVPVIKLERLTLRAYTMSDAADLQRLVGDRAIADTTLSISHPYENGMAEEWIKTHAPRLEDGTSVTFAVTLTESGALVGTVGLGINKSHDRAEAGYWIGVPYWGNGYCTEAAREILRFCFEELELQRVFAGHFAGNEASGHVQRKIGMRHEGVQRWGISRFGALKDRVCYGIILPEWEAL